MRRFLAGAMLFIAVLLGSQCLGRTAYAENITEITAQVEADDKGTEESNESDQDVSSDTDLEEGNEEEEDAEVLGTRRNQNADKFIICIEVAIGLIFLVGLFAAGKGGYEN